MRKVLGFTIMFFPFIALIAWGLYANWTFTVMLFLGTILGIDVIGWIIWFYEAGKKIGGIND